MKKLVLLFSCLFLIGCTNQQSSQEQSINSNVSDPRFYIPGDKVQFTKGVEVTVNSVMYDSDKDLNSDGLIALVVNTTLKNGGNEALTFSPSVFSVLDSKGEPVNMDSSTYRTDFPKQLNPGQTLTVELIYSIENGNGDPYQVSFADAVWETDF